MVPRKPEERKPEEPLTSREAVLRAVRQNKPPALPLPDVSAFERPDGRLVDHFLRVIREIGGRAEEVDRAGAAAVLAGLYPDVRTAATAVTGLAGIAPAFVPLEDLAEPGDMAGLDLLVCEGTLGVAENGAIWLTESQMVHRAAPFLAQHLAILLDRQQLVWNMHEAYARIRVDAEGFGAFIAGPSKTADIEQALVIGAHGPRSLTVLVTEA